MQKSAIGKILLVVALALAFVALNYPNAFAWFILLIIGIAAACILGVIGYTTFWKIRNYLTPMTHIRARVIRRWIKPWDITLQHESPEMFLARLAMMGRNREEAGKVFLHAAAQADETEIAGGTDYYVTFAIGNRSLEFCVPEEVYIVAEEEVEGMLTFKSEEFIGFLPLEKHRGDA